MPHYYGASFAGREKRGGQRGVFDVAAGHRELSTEKSEIQVIAERRLRREHSAPEPFAKLLVGKRKLDRVVHPTLESVVDVKNQVCGQDDEAFILLGLLQ